jgi:predicted phosphodiesterase
VHPATSPLPRRATRHLRALHIPLDQVCDGIRIFNPGSPTDRRRQPSGTIGPLNIDDGETEARIISVDS